jgi:hypothetical protein
MQHKFENGVEDVAMAIASGRGIRDDGPYGIMIGDERLNYRAEVVHSAVVTGAQILAAAGVGGSIEHVAFQVLQGGQLESLRPDESVDLRSAGAEKFVVFRSDRVFRILVDDRTVDWGAVRITGGTIKRLVGFKAFTHDVWQVLPSGEDLLVSDDDFVDLSTPGVERFVVKPISIRVIVNARPREVHKRFLAYWEVVKLAFPDAVPAPNTVYSITYARGPDSNPEGSIVEGQQVLVKSGMTFYVTVTDKS